MRARTRGPEPRGDEEQAAGRVFRVAMMDPKLQAQARRLRKNRSWEPEQIAQHLGVSNEQVIAALAGARGRRIAPDHMNISVRMATGMFLRSLFAEGEPAWQGMDRLVDFLRTQIRLGHFAPPAFKNGATRIVPPTPKQDTLDV